MKQICNFVMIMHHPDQKYIDALLSNNNGLIREMYEKFSNTIKNMVLQQGGNETDAADIFQDALLSIYNRATQGGFTLTCPFEGFLYLICKRKWIKELRKRNRLAVTINKQDTSDINDIAANLVDECLLHESRKAMVVENVTKLGEKCKDLLYLSWEDRPMEEVAKLLGMSYGYARKKKSGCMAKLISLIHGSPGYNSLKW